MLSVPWRTLAGLANEPGELSRIGPVTAGVARALAAAAAAEEACEWRLIVTGPAGRVLAVTSVPRTWRTTWPTGTKSAPPPPTGTLQGLHRSGPDSAEGPGSPGLIARVTVTIAAGPPEGPHGSLVSRDADLPPVTAGWDCRAELRPVLAAALRAARRAAARRYAGGTGAASTGACTHQDAVAGYRVPRAMRALIEARDQTCRCPGCRQPAWRCDQDHTVAYQRGGRTCPCNLACACRRHHRMKQLPDWLLSQPRPGFLTWRTPAGLSYTVTPDAHHT